MGKMEGWKVVKVWQWLGKVCIEWLVNLSLVDVVVFKCLKLLGFTCICCRAEITSTFSSVSRSNVVDERYEDAVGYCRVFGGC